MRAKLPVRAKPTVAFANQKEAQRNIEVKIEALKSIATALAETGPVALADKDARGCLQSLPTSMRQFNAWESRSLDRAQQAKLDPFHRNAQMTLKRSGQMARVQRLLADVKALQKSPSMPHRRDEAVASLRRTVANANSLRQIAERELLESKRRQIALASELEAANRKLVALERETVSQLKEAEKRVAEVEKQLKQLTAKVVPLSRR